MQRKYVLSMIFVIAFAFIFVLSPLFHGKRALTATELAFLQPVYQSSVDFDRIRIKSGGPLTWVYPGITLGNTISFPKHAYDETDRKDQALLVHELCHVWQYQHFGVGYIPQSLWELITQRDTYVVHYDATKTFREYDIEEQCEIMAEYFLTEDERYMPYVEEVRGKK